MASENDGADRTAEEYRSLFAEDDYGAVFRTYFADIIRTRSWSALPAGWYNPYSAAVAGFQPAAISGTELQQYALDEAHALEPLKTPIIRLIEGWEERSLEYSEVTLLPSVSGANLTTLAALAGLGYRTVIFETPTYYATVDQAKLLGLNYIPLPSYRRDGFAIGLTEFARVIRRNTPCSVWITQPRFGIGTNQSLAFVNDLATLIGPENVLVIDEAAEQSFPSTLSKLHNLACPVVRTRGMVKGIGLNGLRIAFAMHPAKWRGAFEDALETAGASLDRFSLANARKFAAEPKLFSSLLMAAREQVEQSQKAADVVMTGTPVTATRVQNGYMGTLMVDLSTFAGSYADNRSALLNACRAHRLPIVLKASAGFAADETWEGVRMNYFTSRDNAVKSAEVLVKAVFAARDATR